MCGRIALYTPPARLARFFQATLADGLDPELDPSWNLGPTRPLVGLSEEVPHHAPDGTAPVRLLDAYRWGLVPPWSKDLSVGNRLFNARAETLATKASFRGAFAERRLVLPVDGFYEWGPGPAGRRQPSFFARADGAPVALAGLWELWRDPQAPDPAHAWLRSCTVITTSAGPDMAGIHDRMPVVLEPADLDRWLETGAADTEELATLLAPSPGGTLVHHPVDPRVGNVRIDDPHLVDRYEVPTVTQPTLGALLDPSA
jgi:putative SOS response-associated peptidase YedK